MIRRFIRNTILWSIIIALFAVMLPPSYKHYREQFLKQMTRVYEKDRAKRVADTMDDLVDRAIPKMPATRL